MAVLGAPGVGKTAIIRQFLFGDYPERHQPTNGPRLYRPAVLLDGAVYDLSIRDGDATGPGHSPEGLEVAVPGAKDRVTTWGAGERSILGAHVLVRVDSPRVPTCVRGLKDECVSWCLCVSSLLADLEAHRTRPEVRQFCKLAFSHWRKCLCICWPLLVGLDQWVAERGRVSLRVNVVCLGP